MRFSGAIVKITSRCNINCSYCYMYNAGDETWRDQPALMSIETIDALIANVANHCRLHSNAYFTYCFHGGEPMLIPKDSLKYFVETARAAMPPGSHAQFLMQTNGMLLTPEWCRLLKALEIKIGVSLDGPQDENDRYRVDHKGRGTYARVLSGLGNAREAGLDYGILSVIDIETSPEETFAHLLSLQPRNVDLLLPEATHDRPPKHGATATPHADWLLRFFESWRKVKDPPFRIRRFDHIIDATLGLIPPLSKVDAHRNEILVVETDGALEPMDVLKICEPGITKTELNVRTHSLDEAAKHPLIRAYYDSYADPCEICANCPVLPLCGGGYFPHRYSQQNGFSNPSVYCEDLKLLIKGVQGWTLNQLPPKLVERIGVSLVD